MEGPASVHELGVTPVAVGAQPTIIGPVWLQVLPAADAAYTTAPRPTVPPSSRVFVFSDVCFERPLLGEASAIVKTVHGTAGPRRIRLLVAPQDGTEEADSQQTLRRRCSDGMRPSPHRCSSGTCAALDAMCLEEERVVTEAEVMMAVAAGSGTACFTVAVVVGDAQEGAALVGLSLQARMRAPLR